VQYAETVARYLELPESHILYSGLALGWPDETAPINTLRTERAPLDAWAELRGF
jgi:hypothetical protein